MKKNHPILVYLNTLLPYYYSYLIPVIFCLIVVSFDFQFHGIFPTTISSTLSSQHKFINDFFAICSYFIILLIFFNYLRIRLNSSQIRQLRLDYRKLTKQQQSLFGFLGLIFCIFILCFFCINWLLMSDTLPEKSTKGYYAAYLMHFSHPYISTFTASFQYLLIIFFSLYFVFILNIRKYI